jgi:hypothetical protein
MITTRTRSDWLLSYVAREDIDENALIAVEGQTFFPYKGLASYYDVGGHKRAAWFYTQAWPEVARVSNLVSFEPDDIEVFLDNKKLALEPGQGVMPHGIDRGLDPDEILDLGNGPARPKVSDHQESGATWLDSCR